LAVNERVHIPSCLQPKVHRQKPLNCYSDDYSFLISTEERKRRKCGTTLTSEVLQTYLRGDLVRILIKVKAKLANYLKPWWNT